MSKTPFVIAVVPCVVVPGDGPSTALNVPLIRVEVILVMTTDPLLPGPSELQMFASALLTKEKFIDRVCVEVLPSV
jgi:hypothetical protein